MGYRRFRAARSVWVAALLIVGLTSSAQAAGQRAPIDPEASAAAVMADLAGFWAGAFPTEFGKSFLHLSSGTVAVDSGASGPGSMCVLQSAQIMGNAFYCPQADGIVYDTGVLVPVLDYGYGFSALVASFAHEYGHAIAARIGPTVEDRAQDPTRYPALFVELQADCYSGTFLRAAARGQAGNTAIDPDGLADAVAPLLDFRDPVTVDPASATAHGLGVDRLQAVVLGWEGSPKVCHEMTLESLRTTLGTAEVRNDGSVKRYSDTDAVMAATRESVALFAASKSAITPIAAEDVKVTAAQRKTAKHIGQFGLASAGVHAAMTEAFGTGPQASCWTGAWVGFVFPAAGGEGLGSWASDPDEALDMLRTIRPSTDELVSFAHGFADGASACG